MKKKLFSRIFILFLFCTLPFIITLSFISRHSSDKDISNLYRKVACSPEHSNVNYFSNKIYKSSLKLHSSLPMPTNTKTAYLTFDDGPSPDITPQVLDILSKNNIKATFFLVGKCAELYPDLVKEEFKRGHSIGNHTYTHNYKYLYSSPKNLLSDLKKTHNIIKSVIPSYDKKLMRFPGGSPERHRELIQAVINEGYRYYNWNCLTQDAVIKNISADKEMGYIKKYTYGQPNLVVLMHDFAGNNSNPQVLQQVIDYIKSQGYIFKAID